MNLYPYYKQVALDIGHTDAVDLNTSTIKILLCENYTYNSVHKYVSDISGAAIIIRSNALASPTVTSGVFDAADITVSAVPTGHTITDLIIYKATGVDSTSTLIANIDQDQASNPLSLPTNGSDVTISFDPAGIFSL